MHSESLPELSEHEFLFRGVKENQWDFQNGRPSSAIYKDSKGVSVDRNYYRPDVDCIARLLKVNDFFSIVKVKVECVIQINALVRYMPVDDNIFHTEIHDSLDRITIRSSKAQKLREKSEITYKRP